MKLENQVTSKEWSEQIQAAGVVVDGLFVLWPDGSVTKRNVFANNITVNAYTLLELLEMLPDEIIEDDTVYSRVLTKDHGGCDAFYSNEGEGLLHFGSGSDELEACAVLLKQGLDAGWLDADEINARCAG